MTLSHKSSTASIKVSVLLLCSTSVQSLSHRFGLIAKSFAIYKEVAATEAMADVFSVLNLFAVKTTL
jgi:hypothetical protein